MSNPKDLTSLYPDIYRLKFHELRDAIEALARTPGFLPLYRLSAVLEAMWLYEEKMPESLRRLYYRELYGPATRFDASNGNVLDAAAYEWTIVHPTGIDRMRAFVSTHLIARLMEIYDAGEHEHPVLERLTEEFGIAAAEYGADREACFDSEAWTEGKFEELFKPLRTP